MKSLKILLSACLIAFAFSMTSCKKKGCTDELAVNYFSKYKKDDGSCSYSTTKMQGRFAYTWNDTIIDTCDVYSFERSYFGIYNPGGFDMAQNEFRFLVEWEGRTMAMPDSLVQDIFPDSAKAVTGEIIDRNSFNVKYIHRIPDYQNISVYKDTVFNYEFERI